MIETNDAIGMVSELISAETEVCKQANTMRGITKKAMNRENQAAIALFKAITGTKPTEEQLKAMVNL